MDRHYTSDTLYHMVGYSILLDPDIPAEMKSEHCFRRLKDILAFGFIAGRDANGNFMKQEGRVQITIDRSGHLKHGDFQGFLAKGCITCYADIPRDCLRVHADKYGVFGFGVSAKHLAGLGARPVMYVPVDGSLFTAPYFGAALLDNMTKEIVELHTIVNAWENAHNPADADGRRTIVNKHELSGLKTVMTRDVAAYIKPYDCNLPLNHPECYYMEREWRLLGNVKITPPKVTTITVAPGYRQRLLDEVPESAEFDVVEI